MNKDKWVDVKEIAAYLGFKEGTIRGWVKEGKIPCERISKEWRFKISVIDEWIESGKSAQVATKTNN